MTDDIEDDTDDMAQHEEVGKDLAVAQALAAAITSQGGGEKYHMMYIAINLMLYINAISETPVEEFISRLRVAAEETEIQIVSTTSIGLDITATEDEEDLAPLQNAPSSKRVN